MIPIDEPRKSLLMLPPVVALLIAGCNRSSSQSPASSESPQEQAARVFSLAQKLEAEGDTKKAYSAYHQLIRNFPTSPYATQANAQIKRAQANSLRNARNPRKKT
jgi:outer membrane protein assembly factor BamD (BamD/ComL family)